MCDLVKESASRNRREGEKRREEDGRMRRES